MVVKVSEKEEMRVMKMKMIELIDNGGISADKMKREIRIGKSMAGSGVGNVSDRYNISITPIATIPFCFCYRPNHKLLHTFTLHFTPVNTELLA